MEKKEREKTSLKTLKYVLIFWIITLFLAACNKKEDTLVPISDLHLGMTLEEVKKSEPDIKDLSEEAGTDCYSIEKEYCGLNVGVIVFLEDGKVSSIIGNADPDPDVDKAVQSFEEYCDKRYTVEEDDDDAINMEIQTKKWNAGECSIHLIITKESEDSEDKIFSFLVAAD